MILGVFLGVAVLAFITSVLCEDSLEALELEDANELRLIGSCQNAASIAEDRFLAHEPRANCAGTEEGNNPAFLFARHPQNSHGVDI